MFRNDELIKRIRGLPNGWINKIEKKKYFMLQYTSMNINV